MLHFYLKPHCKLSFLVLLLWVSLLVDSNSGFELDDSLTYIWPLPSAFTSGNRTFTVDPTLSLSVLGKGGDSKILKEGFERYKKIIFKHASEISLFQKLRGISFVYDISELRIIVNSDSEELQLGVDESYTLFVAKNDGKSIVGEATIEANTVYGALRGLETFSQLCSFDYDTKSVQIYKAPWYIKDNPRFAFRGLLLDTSRHYLPIDVIKQIIESMSYAKLNVLHWHIIDEESFPLEVPSYPKLWNGAYTKWERYTVEDASEIVSFAKLRGIHVMAEVDVPGHAQSWGAGYPDLWPSSSCREPLDVSKKFTFELISGILSDCWTSTPHIKQWLNDHNMTAKDAYQYFVLKAQEIAISKDWTPVNWEETFNSFSSELRPRTIVHNWLGPGVCPKAVAKGFKCIFSNQGAWYLDHLDVPWNEVYSAEPLEGINNVSEENLVLGGEVCMWGETADASNVQQTIWPRAAAAAERLWSKREAVSVQNVNSTVLPRYHYFRCLLNRRGVQAAPATNYYARKPPTGPGSCYEQ
ncbi:beta-hexosaminidase 1-like isoform X2 [Hibiscus syriacus]|uniref:beta-hexosaminidase 1-like isoform X2 n=1 Tax=Hibiscus syriacus TaxID=106335 RepID=UPI001923D471|nr:beta-hexosaminidase 1-like isoform X2 [Hibiscus syriacus]